MSGIGEPSARSDTPESPSGATAATAVGSAPDGGGSAPSGEARAAGTPNATDSSGPHGSTSDAHPERNVLALPAFRQMWAALGLASFGDWLGILALSSLAANLYSSSYAVAGFAVSGVFLLRLAPGIVLGPFAGVVADRFDRRWTMVTANVVRAVMLLSILVIDRNWWLFVAILVMEIASLCFIPAKDAAIPGLVPRERLEAANSLNMLTTYGAAPVAAGVFALLALVSGVLDNLFGEAFGSSITLAIWVNAIAFVVGAALLAPLRELSSTTANTGAHRAVLSTVWQGWTYVFRTPVIRGLVVGMMGAFAAGGTVVGLSRIYVSDLGAGDPGYGVLFAAVFVGLAGGMGVGPRVLGGVSRRRVFGLAITAAGFTLMLVALIPNLVLVVLLTLALGACAGSAWVTGYTLLGLEVPDELRGRTFAYVQTLVRIVLMLVLAVSPAIAGALGTHQLRVGDVRVTYGGAALTMLLAGFLAVALGVVAFRRMDDRAGISLRSDLLSSRALAPIPASGTTSGFFIALEGGEGAGKSTQIDRLAEVLRARGYDVVTTREPGATPVGIRVREVLLDPESAGIDPRAEALLFAADRADHVGRVIRPALQAGSIVLTDRYIDSSLAYQGAGRALPAEDVRRLSRWATDGLVPDITILLDLSPRAGLARARGADGADRLESESLHFHNRVREEFLSLASANSNSYVVVDAEQPTDAVTARILHDLDRVLPPTPAQVEEAESARQAEIELRKQREADADEWQRKLKEAREESRRARAAAKAAVDERRTAHRAVAGVQSWLEERRAAREEPPVPSAAPDAPSASDASEAPTASTDATASTDLTQQLRLGSVSPAGDVQSAGGADGVAASGNDVPASDEQASGVRPASAIPGESTGNVRLLGSLPGAYAMPAPADPGTPDAVTAEPSAPDLTLDGPPTEASSASAVSSPSGPAAERPDSSDSSVPGWLTNFGSEARSTGSTAMNPNGPVSDETMIDLRAVEETVALPRIAPGQPPQ